VLDCGECMGCCAAQVCSDLDKPNGQYVLPNDRDVIMDFMATLPIRKVTPYSPVAVLPCFVSSGGSWYA